MTTPRLLVTMALFTPAMAVVSTPPPTTTSVPSPSPEPSGFVDTGGHRLSLPAGPVVTAADLDELRSRQLVFPVPAVRPADVADTFGDSRRGGAHEALDIPAPRGAFVLAVDDGVIAKLFESVPGGHTVYLFDREQRFAYYYAHLESYAVDLREQGTVRRGDVIGYVGTSGNAAPDDPHLHFAIFKLESEPRWWRGTPINPHPLFVPPRSADQ